MTALSWFHATRDIPSAGLDITREATAEERLELARELDVPGVESAIARYRLQPSAGDRFSLSGRLVAKLVRECVVTLEPLPETVEVELSAIFAEARTSLDAEVEGSLADLDRPEEAPIANGILDVGRIVFEELASNIDPYPRKADAEFQWNDPKAESSPANPFAALAGLRKPPTEAKDE